MFTLIFLMFVGVLIVVGYLGNDVEVPDKIHKLYTILMFSSGILTIVSLVLEFKSICTFVYHLFY